MKNTPKSTIFFKFKHSTPHNQQTNAPGQKISIPSKERTKLNLENPPVSSRREGKLDFSPPPSLTVPEDIIRRDAQ